MKLIRKERENLQNGGTIELKYYLISKEENLESSAYGICIEMYLLTEKELVLLEEKSVLCDGYTKEKVVTLIDLIGRNTVTPVSLNEILLDLRYKDIISV